jgi:hypothetical protein
MANNLAYSEFLTTKAIQAKPSGLTKIPTLPKALRPFQRDIVQWALRIGRAAIFAGTGLGKTIQQLSWAKVIAAHTGKPVLVLTPLAVAQQTVAEAKKFSIKSVAYARDQSEATTSIVVTNYDRIEKFDLTMFGGIVLDESSIIKAHESKTRMRLMELCRDIPYRLCCTATPAPNDYVELGNHAEFLGVMTQKEMLSMWFVHDGSIRATNVQNHGSKPIAEWRLKGHAETEFWRWLSTWAVVIRHPRDIGYEEEGYDLPPLIKHQITVAADYAPSLDMGLLFPMEASTLSERLGARRTSISTRVEAAAKIVKADPDHPWLMWCHLNDESASLTEAISGAVEVRGSDDADIKAERLLGFANGKIHKLVSKPSIAGFGMNFQVCSDMIFVGLNDSFESLFQAIRRCWRFGQIRPVNVYMIASELEGAVVANLEAKESAADRMADAMAEHMADLTSRSLRGVSAPEFIKHSTIMEIPKWMTA